MTDEFAQELAETIGDDILAGQERMVFANFGRLEVNTRRRIQWVDGQPVEVDFETYRKLPRSQRQHDLTITVDIQELNPDLQYGYERWLKVGGPDWNRTFVPSLKEIFGDDAMTGENAAETLAQINGAYVEVHDVPMQPLRNQKHLRDDGTPWRKPKIARIFESKEACAAARNERFGEPTDKTIPGFEDTPSSKSTEGLPLPGAWTDNESTFRSAIVTQLKTEGSTPEGIAKMLGGVEVQQVAEWATFYRMVRETADLALPLAATKLRVTEDMVTLWRGLV